MGPNLAISVNWAKGHSDVLKCFSASTCIKPCEWTYQRGRRPALFLPWKNPILSFAPPTRCESGVRGCDGKGPWTTDETYAKHWTEIHKSQAPLRNCTVLGCREQTVKLQHHIKNKHPYALPEAICRLCRDKFTTEKALEEHWQKEHQRGQNKEDKINCTICKRELSNSFKGCKYHTC